VERFRVEAEVTVGMAVPPERRTAVKRRLRKRLKGVDPYFGPEEAGGHLLRVNVQVAAVRQDQALRLVMDELETTLNDEGILETDRVWGPLSVHSF
jgi:hypothetical protein